MLYFMYDWEPSKVQICQLVYYKYLITQRFRICLFILLHLEISIYYKYIEKLGPYANKKNQKEKFVILFERAHQMFFNFLVNIYKLIFDEFFYSKATISL